MPYGLRRATTADDPSMMALFSEAFGKPFSPAWWSWYRDCPSGANRTRVVADSRGLAGSYSLMPTWLKIGEGIYGGSLCNNVCTSPQHQGRGLFVKLGNFALADERAFGVRVSIGMPNVKALPGHLKAGWRILTALPKLVKEHPKAHASGCCSVEKFAPSIDDFLARMYERYTFAVVKNHRWLNWRYADRPDRYYRLLVLERANQIHGYAVVKHFDDGDIRKSHICDMLADDDSALANLLSAAEDLASGRDRLDLWTNPRDPNREKMLALGYIEEPSTGDCLIMHTNYGAEVGVPEGPVTFAFGDNDAW
jgi:GNAT superfamily N-acetyltransferase